MFDGCYVTDDDRIRHAVEAFGGRVVMTSELHKSGTDRCAEALDIVQSEQNIQFDVVVNIQGDEPFIQPQQLSRVISCFANPDVQIATLVKPFMPDEDVFNPNSPKVILNRNSEAIYFSRSVVPFVRGKEQSLWQSSFRYLKHIGLYAYRADILRRITRLQQTPGLAESLERLRWIENGFRITVVESDLETLAVDTPEDLEKVKALADRMLNER